MARPPKTAAARAARKPPTPKTTEMAIERAYDFRHSYADNVALATASSGKVEMSFFAMHNRFEKQEFVTKSEDEIFATVEPGALKGRPIMMESACVAVTPELAVRLAEAILRHVTAHQLIPPERVAEILSENAVG